MQLWLRLALGAALVCAAGTPASAQFATSFDQLQNVTKPGQTLFVIDREGNETRGRLERISDDSITLAVRRGARQFSEDEIVVVRKLADDSVLNGAAIGGSILGGIAALTFFACDECTGLGSVVVGEFVIGAGLGALVDAFIRTPRDIYRVGKRRIGVTPVVTPTRQGAQVVLRW
jgi:hypothetical protein